MRCGEPLAVPGALGAIEALLYPYGRQYIQKAMQYAAFLSHKAVA